MTSAARSVYVFGVYLLVLGGILIGSPNTLLGLLGIPSTTEPWIRVLGIPVMAIGMLDVACARTEQTGFFRATVWTRSFGFLALAGFAVVGTIPPVLAAFGAVDLVGALWTHASLRGSSVLARAAQSATISHGIGPSE